MLIHLHALQIIANALRISSIEAFEMYGFSSSGILHVEYVVGIRNHFAIHNHIESRVGARIENAIVEKETHNGGNFRWVSIESVPIKLIQTGFRIGLKPQPVFRIHAYGTDTCPICASMVQKGKFAACALALDKQLNNVDLPTFGRPTIPAFNAISSLIYN